MKIILFKNGNQFLNSSYITEYMRNFSTVLDAAFDTLLSFLPSRHIVRISNHPTNIIPAWTAD